MGDLGFKDSSAADSSTPLLAPENHDGFMKAATKTPQAAHKRPGVSSAHEEQPIEQVATELARKLTCCLQLKEKSSVLILGPPGSGKTAALELALNTVQQLARKQREIRRRESIRGNPSSREARGGSVYSSPTRSRVCTVLPPDEKENEPHVTSASKQTPSSPASFFSSSSPLHQGSTAAASPLSRLPSSVTLVSTPSKRELFEKAPETLLPDLLVVRLCCPLFKDDASLLHAIVAKLAQELHCQEIPPPSASVEELSETLKNILITSCSVVSRAVVVVLDHFEVCCLDTGTSGGFGGGAGGGGRGGGGMRRQQLLYNLFDLQHGHNLQICTVCISSVLDITQHMEKRIRSRFSLQTLYIGGPRTFSDLEDFIRQKLLRISASLLLQDARRHEDGNTQMLLASALERDQQQEDLRRDRRRKRAGIGRARVEEDGESERRQGREGTKEQQKEDDERDSLSSSPKKKGAGVSADILVSSRETSRMQSAYSKDTRKIFRLSPFDNILLPFGFSCWEPSQEDWHLAEVFAASWEKAVEEEFSSPSFRVSETSALFGAEAEREKQKAQLLQY